MRFTALLLLSDTRNTEPDPRPPKTYSCPARRCGFVRFALFLVCASFASAQTFSFGVKAGGFFTNPADGADASRKYLVGPAVEIGFGSRLGIDIDMLYSRFGANFSGTSVNGSPIRGNSFEFPVLGKFYFAGRDAAVRPFAGGGFEFRTISFDDDSAGFGRFGNNRSIGSTEPATGAVFGGGVAFRMWRLKLAPEVRYTRWGGYNYPATNPNKATAMLGISF